MKCQLFESYLIEKLKNLGDFSFMYHWKIKPGDKVRENSGRERENKEGKRQTCMYNYIFTQSFR